MSKRVTNIYAHTQAYTPVKLSPSLPRDSTNVELNRNKNK